MNFRKIIAVILCFALCLGNFSALAAADSTPALQLSVSKTGSTVRLAIAVDQTIEAVEALTLRVDYDTGAFAKGSISSAVDRNADWGELVVLTPGGAALTAGESLAELSFTATESYVAGSDYSFAVSIEETLNSDGDAFALQGADCVLREEPQPSVTPTVTPTVEPTVTPTAAPTAAGLELAVSKDGTAVTLLLSVDQPLEDVYGLVFSLSYDTEAFAKKGIRSSVDGSPAWGGLVSVYPSGGSVPAGEAFVELSFTATGRYTAGTEYAFAVGVDQAMDNHGEEIDLRGASCVLREEPQPTEPPPTTAPTEPPPTAEPTEGCHLAAVAEQNGDQVTLTVSIVEAIDDIFGLDLGLSYDREAMKKSKISSPVDSSAIWGEEIVVSPSSGSLAAGDVIAVLYFTPTEQFVSCYPYSFEVFYIDAIDNNGDPIELADVTATLAGHRWGEASYVWAEDNSSVTATRVCENDAGHVETETVSATAAATPATCEEAGATTYTAVFANPAFETQIKTVELPALGHAWGEASYEWAADNGSVTAQRVCAHNAAHVETETAQATSEVTKAATCEGWGETTYTAVFTNPAFEPQHKILADLAPIGHEWQEPSYGWSDDNGSVTAQRVCAHDAAHMETETAQTTSKVTKAATCEDWGEVTYTARFENPAFTTQTLTVSELAPLGHEWQEPAYVWAEDNSSVTATRVCAHDAAHAETETAVTEFELITAPTLDEEGLGRYTARFENEAFETQTKEVVLDRLEGFAISLDGKSTEIAELQLDLTKRYSGTVTFTVTSTGDQAIAVGYRTGEDENYTPLACTDVDGAHSFTVDVQSDIELALVLKGDVNLDGVIKLKDNLMIKKHLARTELLTDPLALLAGDIDGKDGIKLKDNLMVKKHLARTQLIAW